jgi:ATP-dependent Clp protease ATP-binding subunit ClpA
LDKEAVLKLRDRFREIGIERSKPTNWFLYFLRSTGVGKTQLAKVLAKII